MRVRTHLIPAAILIVGGLTAAAQEKKPAHELEARVDARVELLSLIFRLAGSPEYNQPNAKSPYTDEVDAQFGKFRDHAVVRLARELRAQHGVVADAVMSMAVHLEDTQGLKPKLPLAPRPARLDERWPTKQAGEFLEQARSFVKEAGFNEFVGQHRQQYDVAAERLTRKLAERDYVGWFEKFFGARPGARFHVILSLLNGPCNYGVGVRYPDDREEITPIIGASKFDDNGVPVFSDADVSTIAHEFCHSYTNPFVDKYAKQLAPASESLFKHCESTMREQAYGTWKTMMYESLVRACVVRYVKAAEGKKAADDEARSNEKRGFRWTGKLAELLGEYETQRERYATFDAFMPRVVEFFNDYAKESGESAARAPKVVRMIPANGATDVDPALTEIKVFFDRPMTDKAWSVVGGGPHYPESAGDVSYDAEHKVFTMPVHLKAAWSYQFWLNHGKFNSFQSADGVELESVEVNFRTRGE
jgi:hypothetical protein